MTSPAMCVCDGPVSWENAEVHFVAPSKSTAGAFGRCTGTLAPEWSTQEERFDWLSDYFTSKLRETDRVLIEGYAMGAKGRVFHIGENTGLLKHKLWRAGIEFVVAAPSLIKKHATGKGNSNKEAMNAAFVEKTGVDVRSVLGVESWNPSSDVVDAYFACSLLEHDGENLSRRN